MKLNQLANKKLIATGAGTLIGMISSVFVANQVGNVSSKLSPYAKEIAGGVLVAGGSIAMASGNSNVKNAGLGLGGIGVAVVGKSVYDRISSNVEALPSPGEEENTGNGGGKKEKNTGKYENTIWNDPAISDIINIDPRGIFMDEEGNRAKETNRLGVIYPDDLYTVYG